MKLSENWLHSWVNYSLPPAELVNQLTMIGLEIEGIEPVAPEFTHVIVGLVMLSWVWYCQCNHILTQKNSAFVKSKSINILC